MLISHKRASLARLLSGSGVIRGLEALVRRPGLLVLGYHRIGNHETSHGYAGVFSATADDFRDQIRSLQRHFDLPAILPPKREGVIHRSYLIGRSEAWE